MADRKSFSKTGCKRLMSRVKPSIISISIELRMKRKSLMSLYKKLIGAI